jgi:hypothetical protein
MAATSAFLITAVLAAPAAPPKVQWHRALGKALQEAQELHRPVLLYERAMALPALAGDTRQRREIVIARGVNLLKLQRPDDAFRALDSELAKEADGPGSDLLLLGMVMARLQSGQRAEAGHAYATLREEYPTSAATARAAEHIKAAGPGSTPK